jgi:hypothetical protein
MPEIVTVSPIEIFPVLLPVKTIAVPLPTAFVIVDVIVFVGVIAAVLKGCGTLYSTASYLIISPFA